jgi:predicted secreted hydrolase
LRYPVKTSYFCAKSRFNILEVIRDCVKIFSKPVQSSPNRRSGDAGFSWHAKGVYPTATQIQFKEPGCVLEIHPWMADQEINSLLVTYWEGPVRFEGPCNGVLARGSGYVDLTGYAGKVPLP